MNGTWRSCGYGDNRRVLFACFTDDDLVIAFDTFSGDTHLIGYLAYSVFLLLSEKERSIPDLVGYLHAEYPAEDIGAIEESLKGSIEELSYCQLVVSADN